MPTDLSKIVAYYDATKFDYNVVWNARDNLSIHFGFYDENANSHAAAVLNTNRVMAEAVNIQKGDSILDAGCGVGGAAFWLANEREVSVTGITPVGHQIGSCRAKAKELGLENRTSFIQADFLNMPFPDESFDVVWACESVCHATNKSEFYQEAARVLKKGGRLVMAEYMRYHPMLPKEQESKFMSGFAGWAIYNIESGATHFELAKLAGFDSIMIRDCSAYVRVSFRNIWRHCKRWLWLGRLLQIIRIRSSVQHGNLEGTKAICETFLDGLWAYGLLTAVKN